LIKLKIKLYFYEIENNNNNITIHSRAFKLGKRCKHVKNHNIFLFKKIHTFINCKQQIKIYYRIPIVLIIQ